MASFSRLANVPVWYHLRDEPNHGDEQIFREERNYACTQRLADTLEECMAELFAVWPLGRPNAILSMGTIGDGENAHGQGNAFDLSGFVLADDTIVRVFDYNQRRNVMDGVNAHLFLYFTQVLNHFYPNHRDHFHVDFNFSNRDHFRPGSTAQTFFVQAVLRNAFQQDLGTGGRYNDGIDGVYGSRTRQALDRVLTALDLTGSGGLTNTGTWREFLSRARAASFQTGSPGGFPAFAPAPAMAANLAGDNRSYGAVAERVHDRGAPSRDFLDTLIAWAQSAADEVFARNEIYDIYSRVANELGPWNDLRDRKAVMCEVLRVLAGFESSWNWNEGRDLSANNVEHDTTEGGIFQCSANSLNFFREDPYLETVLDKLGVAQPGPDRSRAFLATSKSDHPFAIEYCARLLRHTINHHGPIKHYFGRMYQGRFHDGIGRHLKRDAVAEFLTYL